MSIKSDRWIQRMATEHAMIEPFAENQARAGVISYGVSSYGYDMRVAPEFKIFTNALSAVVDPKRFDPKSFVEFTGDVCIDRKSTRLNSSHRTISYAVFCSNKKKTSPHYPHISPHCCY